MEEASEQCLDASVQLELASGDEVEVVSGDELELANDDGAGVVNGESCSSSAFEAKQPCAVR